MNTVDKYRNLVEKLYSRTEDGSLTWSYDDAMDEADAKIGPRMISICPGENSNEEPIYIVKIRDQNTEVVDKFDDDNIKGKRPSVGGFSNYYQVLKHIYDATLRKSSGADDALDGVLGDLDDLI